MTKYYVSVTGNNNNNGSAGAPWRTISKAMWNLEPGDEVIVGSGTYKEFVRISASGKANAYITVRAAHEGGAKIVPPASEDYGVHIQGDYVKLDGFEVSGASVTGITANLTHHVVISNNVVHGSGGHGISVSRSDYVTVSGNVTYGNASDGPFSGISVFHPENLTGDTSHSGFRIVVRDNVSYNNITRTGAHSDGNGIIMDDFRSTQSPERAPYLFRSLVENNLVYGNGGKGIQVDWSDYVSVRNNTAYHNSVDHLNTGTWRAELSNMNSSHNAWVNNIAVAAPSINASNQAIDNTANTGYKNTHNIWQSNLTYNGTAGDDAVRNAGGSATLTVQDGNLLGVNPMLVNPSKSFSLDPNSPAIDNGTRNQGNIAHDLSGKARTGEIDIGAYEVGSSKIAGNNYLLGNDGGNDLRGYAGNDTLMGLAGTDSLRGGEGNDSLVGDGASDYLEGGKGKDQLVGGGARDILVGGLGADRFVFRAVPESSPTQPDEIRDFSHAEGDKIDLRAIDAHTGAYGDQAFRFIGDGAFSKTPGEVKYHDGVVSGDVNGDKVADFAITIINHPALHAGDFLL